MVEQARRPAKKKLEQLTLELKKAASWRSCPLPGRGPWPAKKGLTLELKKQSDVENCPISQNLNVTNQGRRTSAQAIPPLDEVDSIVVRVKLLM